MPPSASVDAPVTAAALPPANLSGDWPRFSLLLALYFLQGVPIGLASSIPMLLTARGASFSEQALFSLASWPYSLKLLWAPLVDALYTTRFSLGRRKTWIVPVQLLTGSLMISMSAHAEELLGDGGAVKPDVRGLLASFFVLYFLVATQDIAVDGWALELLRPENVGYASTANTIGQGAGVMAAYGLFMALDSADVSNQWVRAPLGLPDSPVGLLSLGGFLRGWGVAFIITTFIVWALQPETERAIVAQEDSNASGGEEAAGTASSTSSSAVLAARKEAVDGTAAGPTQVVDARVSTDSDEETAGLLAEGGSAGVRTPDGLHRRTPSIPRSNVSAGGPSATEASGSSSAAAESSVDSVSPQPQPSSSVSSALSDVFTSYRELWGVARLPLMLLLAGVIVSVRVGFAATDKATGMIMQQRGLPKETIAFLDVLSFPVQLAAQVFILANWTSGPRALDIFLLAVPLRALSGLVHLWLVYSVLPDRSADPWTPSTVPAHVSALVFAVSNAHGFLQSAMFMSQMAFASKVAAASPRVGGSVMTLLNTLANLGSMLPGPLALLAIDRFSYTPVVLVSTVYSMCWYLSMAKHVRTLQATPPATWSR